MGLLRAAFRPADEICALRAVVRHRQRMIETVGQQVQHMHKALTQMNLQIHHVISDITGVTGTAILRAILAGQRDPRRLAELRDRRVKASPAVIVKSLEGNGRVEHLFCLRQSFELYEACLRQIDEATCEIERMMKALDDAVDAGQRPLPPDAKHRSPPKRKPLSVRTEPFDMRSVVYTKYGVDVTQIPGLDQNAVLLLSEVGRDMSRWKDDSHFVAWLALCPDNDISGGKVLWRGSRKQKIRAGQIFRMAAQSQYHSSSEMGDYYRRMRARPGPQAATMATARKIATIFYVMVSRQLEYDPKMAFPDQPDRQMRQLANLTRKARKLGVTIVMPEAGPAISTQPEI
jgi:transposase